ncbi:sigma-w pathway protein ysdB [Bacillus salitolerans]|uniref:Sigma-w pathway protein ysdB n=1 Tax=Bacillus salitolerans TaxID=1437434 RepID=A0ABW4LM26_9BACI
MIIILFRLLILIAMVALIYTGFKYLLNPKRKLELAHEQKKYYFLDDKRNVHKNFYITYRGAMFEGEKYLGTTENSFEVVTINVSVKSASSLQGFTKEDFYFLEREILIQYPHSTVQWKSPIKELIKNHEG